MQILFNVVVVLQLVTGLVMIGLVLIQHGKGADMGASFGSGASGSLFGATGSANFLSRSTAVCAAVFFLCTLSLAYFSNDRTPAAAAGSVLDRPAAPAAAPAAVPVPPAVSAAAPAERIPSGAPPAAADRIPGTAAPADAAASATLPAASGAAAIPVR